MAKPTTVRQAPRQTRRSCQGQKDDNSAPDPSTLRRSGRSQIEKAYSNSQAPVSVVPAESLQTRKRHPVPYLEGQEDIVRSDGEETSAAPRNLGAPEVPSESVQSEVGSPMINGETTQAEEPLQANTPANQELCTQDQLSKPTEVPSQSSESPIGTMAEHSPMQAETRISTLILTIDSNSLSPSSWAPALPTSALAAPLSQPQVHSEPTHSTTHTSLSDPTAEPSQLHFVPPNTLTTLSSGSVNAYPDLLGSFTPVAGPYVGPGPIRTPRRSPHAAGPSSRPPNSHGQVNYQHAFVLPPSAASVGPSVTSVLQFTVNWYARNRAKMYRPKPGPFDGAAGRKLQKGDFSLNKQKIMFGVEHSFVYDIICVEAFPPSYRDFLPRGIAHAERVLGLQLALTMPMDNFGKYIWDKGSNKRKTLLELATPIIEAHYDLPSDPVLDSPSYWTVVNLINNDAFLRKDNPAPGEFADFRHPAVWALLEALFFRTSPKIGLVFIERLCADDTPAPWHRLSVDQSPEAKKGMPIAAITFVCVLILHVLNNHRLHAMGDPLSHFEGRHYTTTWGEYHHKVATFQHLGQLRKELLDNVKAKYVSQNPFHQGNGTGEELEALW